jgi:NAD(P)H-nitrite reductase large subunit
MTLYVVCRANNVTKHHHAVLHAVVIASCEIFKAEHPEFTANFSCTSCIPVHIGNVANVTQ